MILTKVLLPAPFSPNKACTSPCRAVKSTPSSAVTLPKRLAISRISMPTGKVRTSGVSGEPVGRFMLSLIPVFRAAAQTADLRHIMAEPHLRSALFRQPPDSFDRSLVTHRVVNDP